MTPPTARSSYHHGDLRNALVEAGVALADAGGPEAVAVRAAAREVGVTPTAAYRHFADAADLLKAVRRRSLEMLVEAVAEELRHVDQAPDPAIDAIRRLAAMGRAYIRNGIEHPGLFRASLGGDMRMPDGGDESAFSALNATLDNLGEAGVIDPKRRQTATIDVWSAVHGFVRLTIDGPLSRLSPDEFATARESVLESAIRGVARIDSPFYSRLDEILAAGGRPETPDEAAP